MRGLIWWIKLDKDEENKDEDGGKDDVVEDVVEDDDITIS